MRSTSIGLALAALVVLAVLRSGESDGQQPKADPVQAEAARLRIVPVLLIKPGEKKELLLSTSCTVGTTRGGGLDIREIGDRARPGFQSRKIWKRAGLVVELPDFAEGPKVASAAVYAPLQKKGLSAFIVKVAAAENAEPGVYDLHLADFTCNGTCEADFRVLVATP